MLTVGDRHRVHAIYLHKFDDAVRRVALVIADTDLGKASRGEFFDAALRARRELGGVDAARATGNLDLFVATGDYEIKVRGPAVDRSFDRFDQLEGGLGPGVGDRDRGALPSRDHHLCWFVNLAVVHCVGGDKSGGGIFGDRACRTVWQIVDLNRQRGADLDVAAGRHGLTVERADVVDGEGRLCFFIAPADDCLGDDERSAGRVVGHHRLNGFVGLERDRIGQDRLVQIGVYARFGDGADSLGRRIVRGRDVSDGLRTTRAIKGDVTFGDNHAAKYALIVDLEVAAEVGRDGLGDLERPRVLVDAEPELGDVETVWLIGLEQGVVADVALYGKGERTAEGVVSADEHEHPAVRDRLTGRVIDREHVQDEVVCRSVPIAVFDRLSPFKSEALFCLCGMTGAVCGRSTRRKEGGRTPCWAGCLNGVYVRVRCCSGAVEAYKALRQRG